MARLFFHKSENEAIIMDHTNKSDELMTNTFSRKMKRNYTFFGFFYTLEKEGELWSMPFFFRVFDQTANRFSFLEFPILIRDAKTWNEVWHEFFDPFIRPKMARLGCNLHHQSPFSIRDLTQIGVIGMAFNLESSSSKSTDSWGEDKARRCSWNTNHLSIHKWTIEIGRCLT